MATQLSDNLDIQAPKLADRRTGPFNSLSEAWTAVAPEYREVGLSAFIMLNGKAVEYFYESGTADANLVLKNNGATPVDLTPYALKTDVYTKVVSDERFAAILHYHSIGEVNGLREELDGLVAELAQMASVGYVNDHVAHTRQDLQSQIDAFESGLIPQNPVADAAARDALADPQLNWVVVTLDNGYKWRYNGTDWELWDTSSTPLATAANDGLMPKERVQQLDDHETRIGALELLPPGSANLTQPLTVAGIAPNVIGVNPGKTYLVGTPHETVIRDILIKINPATYTAPTLNLSKNQPGVQMVGQSVPVILTANFTQNDAGAYVSISHLQDGQQFSQSNPTPPHPVLFTQPGLTQFQAVVTYAQGPVKNNSAGTPDPNGRIPAGTVLSDIEAIRAVFPWMYGSSATDAVTPSEVYAAAKVVEVMGGSLVVPTFGTGPRFLWFAVPQGSKTFTKWQRSALNAGNIGGTGNLFKNAVTISVTSTGLAANWTKNYDFYITNYKTEAGTSTTLS